MEHHLPKSYFARAWRAIIEFNMLAPGDKVLVGLSGGKDSCFLTYLLSIIKEHAPFPFEVAALTLDPMFTEDFSTAPLAEFCAELGIPYYSIQANIAGAIAAKGKDPCFVCSYFRRAVMNRFAVENGFNKIALAHHYDDAVETFVMGLMFTGQLKTFLPVTHLDRTGLTVIRPLIYFRERELKGTSKFHGFTPLKSPCPIDGKTKRQEVKELIASWRKIDPFVFDHLAAAMRESPSTELWPAAPTRQELTGLHRAFWGKDRHDDVEI